MTMSITLYITVFTVAISILAMYNDDLLEKLIFHPYTVRNHNEWYRFISSGFIHADFMHLAFNMFSFYMFGDYVEQYFNMIFGSLGSTLYIILYVSSLLVCLIPTYFNHFKQYNYRSLGASGAVSAIVFAGIFLQPTMQIGFFIIPPIIPGFVFGPIYLGITAYLSKSGQSGINHSAHLWGSIYGVVFLIITSYFMGNYNVLAAFMEQIRIYLAR
jgi:membrane associated rhomboid family serine protease